MHPVPPEPPFQCEPVDLVDKLLVGGERESDRSRFLKRACLSSSFFRARLEEALSEVSCSSKVELTDAFRAEGAALHFAAAFRLDPEDLFFVRIAIVHGQHNERSQTKADGFRRSNALSVHV